MKQKLLSKLLAIAMVLTLLPAGVFAADAKGTNVAEVGGTEYPTLAAAVEAATTENSTVTLLSDVTITEPVVVSRKITLDMGGKKISNETDLWNADKDDWSLISVRTGGDLTITGNGTFKAKENDCYAVDLQDDDAKCTIENGTFVGNISAVYIYDGKLFIHGGSYSIQQLSGTHNDHRFTINCWDESFKDNSATVEITGGTFSNYDPANNLAEGANTNFCTADYTTVQDGENYIVKPWTEVAVAKVGDTYYKSLVDAYAALPRGEGAAPSEPTTITLLKDSEGGGMGSDTDDYMNYVIDFGGHTYTVGAPAVGSTGTVSQGLRVMPTSTAKFMNGTLKAANYKDLIQVVHTYGNVTFQDFTVDATEDAYAWAAVEPDAGTLKVLGNSSILAREGQYGLYAAFWHSGSYDGTTVDVDTTGKITGKLAYEFDEDYTDANKATENKGFVNIKNGNFDILSIQEIWSDVSDAVDKTVGGIIITGGYFTSDPSAYVAADHYVDASNNGDYPYTVKAGTKTDAPVIVKDATTVTVPDDAGLTDAYKNAIKEKSSVDGVAEAIADNKAALIPEGVDTTSAKKVEIDVSVGVNVTEADLTAGTMTFEAKPVATVTTTKADGTQDKKENVAVPNSLLNGEITVKLPLPEGFTLKQIKHISSDGSVEYFLDTPKTGAKTFKIDETNNCVILKITHFSKFELSTKSDYVEPVYTSAPITKKDVKFDDVDVNAYYAPAVKWAVENKITAGKTDKLFAPDDTCTRGEMITFLWNAAGKPAAKNTTNPFTDVNTGAFYYDAVLWAVSNGITSGTSETTFSPDNTVNRAQVVAFLYNYANKPAAANSTFSDVAADAYYAPAVGWAAAQKITSGTGNNTFSPENDCTRAQIVTFLYNDLAK